MRLKPVAKNAKNATAPAATVTSTASAVSSPPMSTASAMNGAATGAGRRSNRRFMAILL